MARGINARGIERDVCPHHRTHGPLLLGEPSRLPLAEGSCFTVVVSSHWLEGLDDDAWRRATTELARVASDTLIVEVLAGVAVGPARKAGEASRIWWEQRLLEAGFRRHSRSLGVVDFEALEDEGTESILLFQKLPPRAAATYPLPALAPERDLHMDMLREAGRRADAHIARYEWARGWIRPGDVVVDAACGLGYGAAILWDGSEASRVIGLDVSESAIAYARENYAGGRSGVDFRVCDVEPWDGWPDASVDCLVSFETLEHLADPARFLAGARRVLKPGGRFLCSVPHAWVDETGRDPNPHHLHVFDLDRLVEAVSPYLLIDQIYAQSAGGHAARFSPRRLLRDVGWPEPASECIAGAEWLLLSGVRDPLETDDAIYAETVFPSSSGAAPNAVAFARDYVNPWAVHALVMGSFRVRSAHLLTALASRWLATSPPDSADAGAALCVLAYRQLDRCGIRAFDPGELERRIREYCARATTRPHVRRWQISLLFVLGRIRLQEGDLAEAERVFRACAAEDATAFTPHLETKTTEAAWLAGRLALERSDETEAAESWSGVASALERLKSTSVAEWLITPERPAAFESGDGLREITLAIDNATLCANALRRLRDPAGAWRPGPEAADRNHQRNVERLLDAVHQRGGEIMSLREALDRVRAELQAAHEGWRVARETLHHVSTERVQHPDRALREELCRCRAERAALLAKLQRATTRCGEHQLRVGVFGTGEGAMRVWEAASNLGIDVAWFADNDASRQGRRLLWIDVLPPAAIPSHPVDAVVIGSMHLHAIRSQLLDLRIAEDRIVAPDVTRPPEQLHDQLRQEFERMQRPAPSR